MSDATIEPGKTGLAGEPLPEHYIEAQTSLVERSLRSLKHGETFAVLDSYGDCGTFGETPEGIFYRDTRYLSLFELRVADARPLLLSSVIQDDNASLSVDLTNADIMAGGQIVLPRDKIAIARTKLLWEGGCYERLGLRNFDDRTRTIRFTIRFDADFRDLFEVRGNHRKRRGHRTTKVVSPGAVEFRYAGLDDIERVTTISFNPAPQSIEVDHAIFDVTVGPDERLSLHVSVGCEEVGEAATATLYPKVVPFMDAYRGARRDQRRLTRGIATVESSNVVFNEVACRSTSDIYMLLTETQEGVYPAAGIPWFSTVFGRDGIITAMMMLWVDPKIAKGVLRHLAATQATKIDAAADAQPGKILHERRFGEMANLGEVPFRRYYGTVDATPLFVMLAGQYFARTGDRETIEQIWPHIQAALRWCDEYGDRDGDGFVEYFRETPEGLANQGWKDSQDSVFHADGSDAPGAIALCEVQGYVYAAKGAAATIAHALGHERIAHRLHREAEALKEAFQAAYWCEEIGTYALALDGDKKPCRVRSSNAGHALFAGIAAPEHARRVANALTGPEAFSGWGIRTIAQTEPRYNPMSYHNGSIWPHDNTLIAMGLARYGFKREAARVFEALFDAARYQDLRRLPELYCGFVRRPRRGPTSYPVACAPQAWAAASPFGLLAACIGLGIDHDGDVISFTNPSLPDFLDEVMLRGLTVGSSQVDVRVQRRDGDVTVSILSRTGSVKVAEIR